MGTGSNYATEYNKLTDAEVYQLRRCNLIFFNADYRKLKENETTNIYFRNTKNKKTL